LLNTLWEASVFALLQVQSYDGSSTSNTANSSTVTDPTIHSLAELSLMMHATYFVGTFNRNVAALAAGLRGCRASSNKDAYRHFARSYGVDRETFYLN